MDAVEKGREKEYLRRVFLGARFCTHVTYPGAGVGFASVGVGRGQAQNINPYYPF